jgi:chitin disaccharide deacetylase
VTADDFGLAEEVNAAVETAHRHGIVSAASLMVNGPAAADAVRRARNLAGLRVGLHVVLVDGAPVLPPDRIPALVDRTGRLRSDLFRVGVEIACRNALRAQLRAEIEAQFECYRRTGLALDHVDAHRHFHLHPIVARELIAAGRRHGMRAMRIPAEPRMVVARIDPRSRTSSWVVTACAALLRAQALHAGLRVADAVFGLAWSGALTQARLVGLLDQLPDGLIEIYAHPAVADRFPGHARGYRYAEELAALCAPATHAALRRSGFRLGSYGGECEAEGRTPRAPPTSSDAYLISVASFGCSTSSTLNLPADAGSCSTVAC